MYPINLPHQPNAQSNQGVVGLPVVLSIIGEKLGIDSTEKLIELTIPQLSERLDSMALIELFAAIEDELGLEYESLSDAWTAAVSVPDQTLGQTIASAIVADGLGEPTSVQAYATSALEQPASTERSRAHVLAGSLVELRAVLTSDIPWLTALLAGPEAYRWRLRGEVPGPAAFQEHLNTRTLCHFVAALRDGSDGVGYLCTHSVDPRDQVCHIAGFISERYRGSVEAIEAWTTFIGYLFTNFPMRRMYIEVPAFNVGGATMSYLKEEARLLRVEGCLSERTFHDGRWWDVYIMAIERRAWARYLRPAQAHMPDADSGFPPSV